MISEVYSQCIQMYSEKNSIKKNHTTRQALDLFCSDFIGQRTSAENQNR